MFIAALFLTLLTPARACRAFSLPSQHQAKGHECIAWKDFCEDVGDAVDTTNGKAQALASTRGAILDIKSLI